MPLNTLIIPGGHCLGPPQPSFNQNLDRLHSALLLAFTPLVPSVPLRSHYHLGVASLCLLLYLPISCSRRDGRSGSSDNDPTSRAAG